uniref:AlNc14C621G12264 protein n=1 Tax=Albugo laibachii Nc14 TaxID=890382 RepID=F0X1H3_9STRA|nr:AlNc14C621G12264 [Albugo laibachii Nc14]|eukprot:CCA27659.1 AlNc14C621G12264 [Albugo laibachii Nc14]
MSNSPDTPTEFIPGPCATVGMKSYCNLIKCDKSPFQRVCGSDGFEYSSRCQAERMQCFEASLSWIDEPCDDLDTPKSNSSCLRVSGDGSGVCGSDQYFYESECIFEYAQKTIPNLTKVNDGKCTECNMYCLDNYDPVCGYSRGIEKSYPNECARKNEICEDPTIKPC